MIQTRAPQMAVMTRLLRPQQFFHADGDATGKDTTMIITIPLLLFS